MLLQILTYTHHLTTMLFGIFLSAFFLGVKQNKKNVCILLGGGAVSGLFFLVCNTVFGSLFTEAVYPIFVHLPLFLLLVFYYRFRWLPSIISIMTAYLCCQFSNWAGIFALSLSGLDWVYYLVRIIVTVAVFAFLSRYLCQTTALLLQNLTGSCISSGQCHLSIMYLITLPQSSPCFFTPEIRWSWNFSHLPCVFPMSFSCSSIFRNMS